MAIKVVNIRSKQEPDSHREYCGRAGKGQEGILGNPFWMNEESKREEVCDKFKVYLDKEFARGNSKIHKRIHELVAIARVQNLELACFCSPKRCHAESIKELIETLLRKSCNLEVKEDTTTPIIKRGDIVLPKHSNFKHVVTAVEGSRCSLIDLGSYTKGNVSLKSLLLFPFEKMEEDTIVWLISEAKGSFENKLGERK